MAGRERIRVAAAQYPLDRLATPEEAECKLSAWVARGALTGAELLVFPEYGAMELAATRGEAAAASLDASLAAVSDSLPRIDALHAALARRHRIHILAASGPSRRPDGRHVNAARLFSPAGNHVVIEKRMMTPFERDWGVVPGAPLAVIETSLGRLGVAICYDCEFPLLVRPLAEAGAEVVPQPCGTPRRAPAVDLNTGAAGIFVPAEAGLSETGVVAEGRLDEPGWVTGEVDLAALRRLRSGGEMRNRIDWDAQPGAVSARAKAEVVRLD